MHSVMSGVSVTRTLRLDKELDEVLQKIAL